MRNEFSGVPLVAGSIFGLRTWNATSRGLTGRSYTHLWRDGENVARCGNLQDVPGLLNAKLSKDALQALLAAAMAGVTAMAGLAGVIPFEDTDPSHVAKLDCSCGYWAYTDMDMRSPFLNIDYMPTLVLGVIEGYGRVTVGSKGFRCQKAKIRGLVLPDLSEEKDWNEMGFWEKNRHRKTCLASAHSYEEAISHPPPFPELRWTCSLRRSRQDARVREQYPNVQHFQTVSQMLEAIPVTPSTIKEDAK